MFLHKALLSGFGAHNLHSPFSFIGGCAQASFAKAHLLSKPLTDSK